MRVIRSGLHRLILLTAVLGLTVTGCRAASSSDQEDLSPEGYGVFYEIFPYTFYDSDGDGIGDLQGIIEKLDYIQDGGRSADDLGANGIWLMPVMPSPTYHKYDVKDYYSIDPEYGTLEDFDELVAEAEVRDLDIIIDLVLNHSSSEHPWFLEAAEGLATGQESKYSGYYNFSDQKHSSAWHPVPGSDRYYEGVFWSAMPDLNLDNEDLRAEIIAIASFWLERGVAGFRLDAVTHFYAEDHPRNIEFLRWFNDTVKALYPETYIVIEAWDSFPVYTSYLASGVDSAFDFAFADNLGLTLRSVNMEDGASYAESQINADRRRREVSETAINAPFLTNHDTGRLAGFTASDLDKTRLAQRLNILAPGNPFIYYGEELGYRGAGRDENKRAPMLWSAGTEGLTAGPADMERDRISYPFGSVEDQTNDPDSILSHVRDTIRFKQRHPALFAGSLAAVPLDTPQAIAAMALSCQDKTLYLLTNFSNEEAVLDLSGTELEDLTLSDELGFSETAQKDARQLILPGYHTVLLSD